jgi:hypothetical protein
MVNEQKRLAMPFIGIKGTAELRYGTFDRGKRIREHSECGLTQQMH